jgi:outer membrane protein assembly factor BamB
MITRELLMDWKSTFVLAALVLTGCAGSGPAHKPAELVPLKPTVAPKVLWQGSVGDAGKNAYFPAVVGNVVYAGGAAGDITGFDTTSGKIVTRIEAGQRISGGVGSGNGLLLVGTSKGLVLAFDREGKEVWKAQLAGEVLAPPEAQDGIVAARAGDGRIYGLDVVDGSRKWIYQRATPALSVRTHAGVVLRSGGVFAGFPGGRLVALVLADGNVGWEGIVALPRGATELERVADITSLPVIEGRQVCAVAFQGRLACFDAMRGTPQWARDVSSAAGIAVDGRYLYVTDEKNAVLAFERASGASIWRQDKLAGRGVSAPLAFQRFVVVGDFEGYLHFISREDGSFVARIATDGGAIVAPPVELGPSSFLVQTRSGGVFAITVQ